MKLILASNSKTRKDIFDMVGWKYEVVTSKVDEHSNSIDPKQYVIDLSNCQIIATSSKKLLYSYISLENLENVAE